MATGHLFQNKLWLLSRHMLPKGWNCRAGIDNRGIVFKCLFLYKKINICCWLLMGTLMHRPCRNNYSPTPQRSDRTKNNLTHPDSNSKQQIYPVLLKTPSCTFHVESRWLQQRISCPKDFWSCSRKIFLPISHVILMDTLLLITHVHNFVQLSTLELLLVIQFS